MKPGIKLMIMLSVILIFTGCYVHIKTPYDSDIDKTELGSKVGVAHAYSLFYAVSWGDASYAAAAKNGNIKTMRHADQETTQILLGMYTHWRVIVYGD
ncbi:MAG: TRL domain-containing protein [Thermodesulfobacteriota bacterium]|nr:TRL domain-containing protein [Thermodesulfobacteriota bacterium]